MNSRFAVMDLRSGETICYTLVYPEDASLERGKLCVLSPMGMALLGARVGDIAHWNGASGPGSAEVLRLLYQPEAAGDRHL
jgi:regulator of nucleoside diphosphate kinase